MKTKLGLPFLTIFALGISFSSCTKTNTTAPETSSQEISTTTDLAGKQATSDNLTEDANNQFMSLSGSSVIGGRPSGTTNITTPGCATVTGILGSFPKTVVIDFGAGCTDGYGITRSGSIQVVVSDTLRKSGSTATMTFDNYIVDSFSMQGTITWTNTSTDSVKSWSRTTVGGKTTDLTDGSYWTYSGNRIMVQTAGYNTPLNPLDDVFSITGSNTVTNDAGRVRTCTIDASNPLIKAGNCRYISQGDMKLQGPNHYAIIDFGNGVCDNFATISIDGLTPITFRLR